MSRLRPEPGLVIMFEAQFPENVEKGRLEGEAHPCMVVWTKKPNELGDQRVLLAPISHSEPRSEDGAIPVPKVDAARVGLDARPMWIYPDKLTALTWPGDRLPSGIREIARGSGEYAYPGIMPERTAEAVQGAVGELLEKGRARVLETEKLIARHEASEQGPQTALDKRADAALKRHEQDRGDRLERGAEHAPRRDDDHGR